jgi:hypothetical protein
LDFADRWGSTEDLDDPIAAIRRAEADTESTEERPDDQDEPGEDESR